MKTEIAEKLLKDRGCWVTKTRVQILQCLHDGHHFHSAREICDHGNMNKKTVYNSLKVLVAKGLVDTFSYGGVPIYAINDNIFNEGLSVHIMDGEEINHIELSQELAKKLKKEVDASGKKINNITIFATVEN